MGFNNRTYAIIDYPPSPDVWPVVMERDATCRKSLDGTKVIVKWEGATPAPLIAATQLTHAEALVAMHTPEWTRPMEEEEE